VDVDDQLWSEMWPIHHSDVRAGMLYRSLNYGTTATGKPRWSGMTRDLYWGAGSPKGIRFDLPTFDSAEEALSAWSEVADDILNKSEDEVVNFIRTIDPTSIGFND
jgi:hypothetical protein